MPRPRPKKKPDVFQLAVAARSYSSVDGYRKEIEVLTGELARANQRCDDQARDFARERDDLQRQLRVKNVTSPETPRGPERAPAPDAAGRWEGRCALLAAQGATSAATRAADDAALRDYAARVACDVAAAHEKRQLAQLARLGTLGGRVGAAVQSVQAVRARVAATRDGDRRVKALELEFAVYKLAQTARGAFEAAREEARDDAAGAAFGAAADDALRQARLYQTAATERDALKVRVATLAAVEHERAAAEEAARREAGVVAELRARLAAQARPGVTQVTRACQVDEAPAVNGALCAAAAKCREAVEAELRAAAAFAHLHDLLKVAALNAAAAAHAALETKLATALARLKHLRLALAAAGGADLATVESADAERGDAAAAAAARLRDMLPAAKAAISAARAARSATLDDLCAAAGALPPPPPEERSTRELLAADFGR